jgi:hypothetical protein
MSSLKSQEVISKFGKIHGDRYDYSEVEYITAKTKVVVICRTHGEFLITPNNHLSGGNCPKCSGRGFSNQEAIQRFIASAISIHGDRYDYSLVESTKGNISIRCKTHGIFLQSKTVHITNKSGCPQCGRMTTTLKTLLSKEKFIEKSKGVHGNRYSYEKVIYSGAHKKVTIGCATHGDFQVTPANHWSNGVGCPSCLASNPSKGEIKIAAWLDERKMSYESQKSFPGLYYKSNKGRLRYDFYLPEKKILIEFDGEYHYRPISFCKEISAADQLKITQCRDQIKSEYANMNGYKLIRIRFDEDIPMVLSKNLD